MQSQEEKKSVQQFWDNTPCGTRDTSNESGTLQYYETIAAHRYKLEYFIPEYAQFDHWAGKKVLEIGCGAGSDLLRFAQGGAIVTGVDLSPRSAMLTKQRLLLYNCTGSILNADAENLPFKDNTYDLVYSWGVLHHTPDTEKAMGEIRRVLSPGGHICIMLYHRHSLVALQLYMMYGLFALKPHRSLEYILAHYHESPGTKAYTISEIRKMFSTFKNLEVKVQLTPYDLRYGREKYFPRGIGKFVPQNFGFFIIIRGQKG
jgi:ubiquinone/menaquinone biosynthesis C-methylase UbiE